MFWPLKDVLILSGVLADERWRLILLLLLLRDVVVCCWVARRLEAGLERETGQKSAGLEFGNGPGWHDFSISSGILRELTSLTVCLRLTSLNIVICSIKVAVW